MFQKSLNKWRDDYEKQLSYAEKRIARKIAKYYEQEYNKGVRNLINTGETNYQYLFEFGFYKKLYTELYEDVGMQFANWYFVNNKKYIVKKDNKKNYTSTWRNAFNYYAGKVAATNVVIVSGTAKMTLLRITRRLYRDPDFVVLGADERARILRKQFKSFSRYQALRIARTESCRAGNYGIEQSALSVYAGKKMKKQWITSMDNKEREWHARANNQIVDFDKPFVVGGENMMRPGEGSGYNVINCRCSMIPFPVDEPKNPTNAGSIDILGGIIVANTLLNDN